MLLRDGNFVVIWFGIDIFVVFIIPDSLFMIPHTFSGSRQSCSLPLLKLNLILGLNTSSDFIGSLNANDCDR